MGFEVVIGEFDRRIRQGRADRRARSCYHVPLAEIDAAACGQVELAEWLTTIGEDADTALRDLATRGEQMASALRSTATSYQTTEDQVQNRFLLGGTVPQP